MTRRAMRQMDGEDIEERARRLGACALAGWRGGRDDSHVASHDDLLEFFVCGYRTAAEDWICTSAPMAAATRGKDG